MTASLEDDQADDVVVIDLAGKTSIADYMVLASGRAARHVAAMADHLAERLRGCGQRVATEGLPQADWVLLDAGNVLIHLFRPEVRAFYDLEKMWGATPAAERQSGGGVPPMSGRVGGGLQSAPLGA